jgi:hypothetical protein
MAASVLAYYRETCVWVISRTPPPGARVAFGEIRLP